jgi:hypothetical protein
VGHDSSVGIAKRYGLNGPAIESLFGVGGGETSRADRIAFVAPQVSYTTCAVLLSRGSGVKLSLCDVDHSPHLVLKFKKE